MKKEFGDFQTPDDLAARATALVAEMFGTPNIVVEPTAGRGAFLKAAAQQWGRSCRYEGYEINREYIDLAKEALDGFSVTLFHRDFFSEDWKHNLGRGQRKKVLVLGNSPWITNSALGLLGGCNLPPKTNFQKLRGLDARTGKSNFDIAEWMLIRLIEALPPEEAVAMLCKTMTARKVLRHCWKTDQGRTTSSLFQIDAKDCFKAAVDACFLVVTGGVTENRIATVYSALDLSSDRTQFGSVNGDLVSDWETYKTYRSLDGGSSAYTWRSGVKHDAAKIMEFRRDGTLLRNGLGEAVDVEEDSIYPLLKSSDLGNGRAAPRKHVLITQTHTGSDTATLASSAPKTWQYLLSHAEALDGRTSVIYRNRPRFSIFGVGPYSFAPWKVAISGLYKKLSFVVVPPSGNRPVMIDDTCYSVPCTNEAEAQFLCDLLSSEPALAFLRSLVFMDAKRPITIDVLRRLSFTALARQLGKSSELASYVNSYRPEQETERQMPLLMESRTPYEIGPAGPHVTTRRGI